MSDATEADNTLIRSSDTSGVELDQADHVLHFVDCRRTEPIRRGAQGVLWAHPGADSGALGVPFHGRPNITVS